jgi:UDP-N-acetylglucosamine enolpyruvyl transferase
MGIRTVISGDSVRIIPFATIRPANIKTREYPGFPTDLQAGPRNHLRRTADLDRGSPAHGRPGHRL